MNELVFLLEERSAQAMLEGLVPRINSENVSVRYIVFEGKQDLEKQLTKRIKNYQNPDARFLVMRDQDSQPDCTALKAHLLNLVRATGKCDTTIVRIACKELETFYLADLSAVERGLGIKKLSQKQGQAKFRAPDSLGSPASELRSITNGTYQKVSGSRAIGPHLDIENSRSPSFKNLVRGIRRLLTR